MNLQFSGNKISNIDEISKLEKLVTLDISNNNIGSIDALVNLK